MNIAAYVRINRKRLGIRQSDLADKLGVARTTIVGIEQGKRKLKVSELAILRDLGFPDEQVALHVPESEHTDERWMWLDKDERTLIRAFRQGRIERVLRMCLAHKDQRLSAMELDEVENG
jgi:transcriptional regulator with XRE-family HTH domain